MTPGDVGFWLLSVGGAVLVGVLVQRAVDRTRRARLRQEAHARGLTPHPGSPEGWSPPEELGAVRASEWWEGPAPGGGMVRVFSLRSLSGAPRGFARLEWSAENGARRVFTVEGALTSSRLRVLWRQWSTRA